MFDKNTSYNNLPLLAWDFNYDQTKFLKLAIKATGKLEKLNGLIYLIPNKNILIAPLLIKESVESSAIENINTTTLKVLQSKAIWWKSISWAEKEVLNYHSSILKWFEKIKKYWWIWYNTFIDLQTLIEPNKPWIRKLPWAVIWNWHWDIIYTPPEWKENIDSLLWNLEKFINNHDDDIDPLIKMPVIHYQFESIHPFYDWNWRTWRILNVLYLVLAKKLDFPVLFLSEYINKSKTKYYELLNKTTKTWDYSEFIIYFLEAIIFQADSTSTKILNINNLMQTVEKDIIELKMDYHKITNLLFSEVFISVKVFQEKMWVAKSTAIRIIKKLESNNIISSVKIWKNKLIFIQEFIDILS